MARPKFTFASFIIRIILAMVLVFLTYNPLDPWSYYHWALRPLLEDFGDFTVLKGLAGVALLIGWGVFLGATLGSLGLLGTLLVALFFGLLLWWLIDIGWISMEKSTTLNWLALVALSLVLGAGVSWSHIRRRLTGQVDVDETEE